MDFVAEDLDPDASTQKDDGNLAHFENPSVSEETRQLMQKSLMALLVAWGDTYLDQKKNPQGGK
jgi:hypothetical protein